MPTVEENLECWDAAYDWKGLGEEWSSRWGSSEAQWFGALLPRIHRFLPAERVLEIAPGYGRWTEYLKSNCNSSIDLAFSFDSLVHVEVDVIQTYLHELAKKLRRDGVAFLHHSNAGEYSFAFAMGNRLPNLLQRSLVKARLLDHQQGRALSMTARRFEECAVAAGLKCVSQELINWDSRRLIDCISIVTLQASRWACSNQVVRNPDFMRLAGSMRRLASISASVRSREGPLPGNYIRH
jgi:hypothetical protein